MWNLLLVIGAAAPLVGVVGDFVLAQRNQELRAELDRRQQLIAQAARLAQVDQALVREIALTAVRMHDPKLGELLAHNGITVRLSPGEPGKGL